MSLQHVVFPGGNNVLLERNNAPHSKNDKPINVENTVRIRIEIAVELAE
jgi:hypothetical protein